MSSKRTILYSPLIVAPLLTTAVYGTYLAVLGRVSTHIMGPLASAFHLISLITLSAAFAWYFQRDRQPSNPVAAMSIAMAGGLLSWNVRGTFAGFSTLTLSNHSLYFYCGYVR